MIGSTSSSVRIQHQAATLSAAVLLTMALVSFRPYLPAENVSAARGGDIVNQLGFGSLGALALLSLLCLANPATIARLPSFGWTLLIGLVIFSTSHTGDPSTALRTFAFTGIAVFVVATSLVLPRSADDFSTVLCTVAFIVLGLSYAGLVLFPDLAKHYELADQIGLWRGLFSHKNIAGPVMAMFTFAGLYLMRRGWWWSGLIIGVAALIFLLNTGSKTTVALVPLAVLAVTLPSLVGMRLLAPVLSLLILVVIAVVTIGTVFFEPVREFVLANFEDPTYTGRVTVWEYGVERLALHPWQGFGFDNFWGTSNALDVPLPFDMEWDVRNVVHGHNGYLDIAMTMGIPALIVFLAVCIVTPMVDYLRAPMLRENVLLADLFLKTLLFTSVNGLLESFFFRRADPVWLIFVFAVLGLRLVARTRIPTRTA